MELSREEASKLFEATEKKDLRAYCPGCGKGCRVNYGGETYNRFWLLSASVVDLDASVFYCARCGLSHKEMDWRVSQTWYDGDAKEQVFMLAPKIPRLKSLEELRLEIAKVLGFSEEDKRRAREYFSNPRSRNTHGDGHMHERSFNTYGSCPCPSCCAYALALGPLSNAFRSVWVTAKVSEAIQKTWGAIPASKA